MDGVSKCNEVLDELGKMSKVPQLIWSDTLSDAAFIMSDDVGLNTYEKEQYRLSCFKVLIFRLPQT